MNQKKIGKFIQERRKLKELTQVELADKLGVSNRTISSWENGNSLPDYSMFQDLCKELDISINELLSGEKLTEENYQKKLEENIVNTIDYNNKKRNQRIKKCIILIIILLIIYYIKYLLRTFIIRTIQIMRVILFLIIKTLKRLKFIIMKKQIQKCCMMN